MRQYNHVIPQSYVTVIMKNTILLFSFLLGLMASLVVGKEVDLGEVLNPALGGRPLFEDIAYDANVAFDIFLDNDESFNLAERNEDGPKAPKFNNLMAGNLENSDKKNGTNLNPDLYSCSSSFSTHIIVFAALIICLESIIF